MEKDPVAPRLESGLRGTTYVAVATLILALASGGCSIVRPVGSLAPAYRMARPGAAVAESEARRCLLVLLPGIGDSTRHFERHGFVEEARAAGLECDLALVDAHFTYYLAQQVVERISEDVLEDARARGYDSVWLVGVSIGGYGAIQTARERPELVDGVVLLSPMIGVGPREDEVYREIATAGGLRAWPGFDDAAPRPPHHFREPRLGWDWLRDATTEPDRSPRVVLGYGAQDRRASRYELLAAALDERHVFRAEGAHDWPTWRGLWRQIVTQRPWESASLHAARSGLDKVRTMSIFS